MASLAIRTVVSLRKLVCNSLSYHAVHRNLSYKSAISLDTLYPNSTLKISTPSFKPLESNEKFDGYIPLNKLDVTYSCSSGPGGQNVNKVNTKVDLRFKLDSAEWLHPDVRDILKKQFKNKLTKEGYLVIRSDLTRSQQLNLADCLQKLRTLIRVAAEPPPAPSQESIDRARKRQEKANQERLMVKRTNSIKRQQSRPPTIHDL